MVLRIIDNIPVVSLDDKFLHVLHYFLVFGFDSDLVLGNAVHAILALSFVWRHLIIFVVVFFFLE